MNERTLELAIEARKYAESKPDIYQVAYDKKFAELIVDQCFRVALVESGGYLDPVKLRDAMKKHFGVEE